MVASMQRPTASPSISDITALLEKSRLAYDDCSDASGGYKDLRKEVRKLRDTLRDLKAEFKDPASEVNRERKQFSEDLTALVEETNKTLDGLLDLVDEYFKRKSGGTEEVRLRQADADQIGNMRVRLISCRMFVDGILEGIEKQERRNERKGVRDEELLVDLLRRMGRIADGLARSREYEEDMEETWRVFRDKLMDQGVPNDDLAKYGSNLRRHLRKLIEDGRLSQNSDSFRSREPLKINTSHWLDGIYTPPLSIVTINSATSPSIKELGSREENIKFPQAMKSQRAMPGGRNETDNFRVGSWNSNGSYGAESNAMAMVRVPEPEITTTDLILRDDYVFDRRDSVRLLSAPPIGDQRRQRRESEEVVSGSPFGSVRGTNSFGDGYRPRLTGLRPGSQDGSAYGSSPRASGERLYGSSPSASGASLFGSSPTPNLSGGMYGHSPRPSLSGLAGRSSLSNGSDKGSDMSKASTLQPDQAGRPIPANAQWTKVNRKLISPEVLNGGGYRYEARENYVAILGVLSREELQGLAERTMQVRANRSKRSRETRPSERDRPVSRGENGATPTPATFNHPPHAPSAFVGAPFLAPQNTPRPAPPPLKPILKNSSKSVRFDDDDLRGSDLDASETSTPSWTTDSDTESSSDRRRIDTRDARRPRSEREGDRTRRDRDSRRERDDRGQLPMGHGSGRAQPMPINAARQDQYMSIPSSGHMNGRKGSWENESRGNSYNSRDQTPRKDQTPRGTERNGNAGWSQKLTAGGIGAAAGTIFSLATDVLLEGLI